MAKRFALLFLILALSAVGSGQSKKETSKTPAPLQLTARTDRQTYLLREELQLEVLLLNAGDEDIYIWDSDLCWNPARGLSMYITAPDGSAVRGDFLLDCLPPPPREGVPYSFIKISPGEVHGRVDTFKITDLVDKPGEFDIRVTYNSFLSAKWIQDYFGRDPIAKLPLWTMEKPTVTAARVHVVITPK